MSQIKFKKTVNFAHIKWVKFRDKHLTTSSGVRVYHFWNPNSGLIGGLIMGAAAGAAAGVISTFLMGVL